MTVPRNPTYYRNTLTRILVAGIFVCCRVRQRQREMNWSMIPCWSQRLYDYAGKTTNECSESTSIESVCRVRYALCLPAVDGARYCSITYSFRVYHGGSFEALRRKSESVFVLASRTFVGCRCIRPVCQLSIGQAIAASLSPRMVWWFRGIQQQEVGERWLPPLKSLT